MIYELVDYIALFEDPPKIKPLQADEIQLMTFFNLSADLMWTLWGYVGDLEELKVQISDLIQSIEQKYKFDRKRKK
jgi:hypothetical protein